MGNDRNPYYPPVSKAWYLLPIFLGIIGGLASWAAIRGRNPPQSRKMLMAGAITTALFVGTIAYAGYTAQNLPIELSTIEIRTSSIAVPYDSLMENPDSYVGEIIRYEGEVIQVRHMFGDDYVLRVRTADTPLSTDAIWSNFEATSEDERAWLDGLADRNVLDFESKVENPEVYVWGTFKGLRTYTTVIGAELTVPEADVLIMELKPSVLNGQSIEETQDERNEIHAYSYGAIPIYADSATAERALHDAIASWESSNPGLFFEPSNSNPDVMIGWAKWMPPPTLGRYSQGSMTILVGIEDCNSEYRTFSKGALTHTITHELGHHLGLRHIDLEGHLMHSAETFDVDSQDNFNDMGYDIPRLENPEPRTVAGAEIVGMLAVVEADLERIAEERVVLRENLSGNELQEALDGNTERHNVATDELERLESLLDCVTLATGF